jgi:glycosyltransferase involved in cell wall biosynthesis
VYPPVDTEFYTPDSAPVSPRFLIVSALVPYKRVDLAMAAARHAGVRLTVVGDGPEREHLAALAGPDIELVGRQSDEVVRQLYRTSIAAVLPGEEDFGIVPVESQACGRPVVALGRGGALDTVIPGMTGVLVSDLSVEALSRGLREAADREWDGAVIRRQAERFSRDAFEAGIVRAVDELMAAPPHHLW